jgi:hypothetical protein
VSPDARELLLGLAQLSNRPFRIWAEDVPAAAELFAAGLISLSDYKGTIEASLKRASMAFVPAPREDEAAR